MDDMLTIALVVLICSIVVMFSTEFGELIKKIFAIRGMKLFLPLFLATFLVVYYEPWVLLGLSKIQTMLSMLATKMITWLPFEAGANILANVVLLVAFSLLPVFALNAWSKRKNFQAFQYSYLTSTIIWLFVAVLIVLMFNYY